MSRKVYEKSPRRLVDAGDIGPLIGEAAKVSFDEQRLQRNRAALMACLSAEINRGFGFGYFPYPRRQVAWAAFSLLLLISAGAGAVVYFKPFGIGSTGGLEDRRGQKFPTPSSTKRIVSPLPEQEAEPADEEISGGVESPTDFDSRGRGRRSIGKNRAADSTLDEQVRLFNRAKERLVTGDHRGALNQLNRLQKRYPASPLSMEAKELRAHVLAGLQRYGQASRTVKSLIRSKAPARKKAQLYRFLGDLQVKQNRCDAAVESYRRALGLGLSGTESAAAKAGIRKCAS